MLLDIADSQLMETICSIGDLPPGAHNIRKNGLCISRLSVPGVEIRPKEQNSGIDVIVAPGVKDRTIHIPVLVTATGMHDIVYNTFVIGEGADIILVAGCGVHNPGELDSRHDGHHEILVKKNARLGYFEKHYGEGSGSGARILNPKTTLLLEEGAVAEMQLVQIKGVDSTVRVTGATLHQNARLIMTERLLTHGKQLAESSITVRMAGRGASTKISSRSVAQDDSEQIFRARLVAEEPSRGHVECDSIIMDRARISSSPELSALHSGAELTHEAAIGKIAGDQLIKLMSLGLPEEEAREAILKGFLS
jgi:Fe-S cluster assembly scaffold protein SufB